MTFDSLADLGRGFLGEVGKSQVSHYRHILGRIACADATVIFMEGNVEAPMEAVFKHLNLTH